MVDPRLQPVVRLAPGPAVRVGLALACGLLLVSACSRESATSEAPTTVQTAKVEAVAPVAPVAAGTAALSADRVVAAALAGQHSDPLVVRVISHRDASSYTWLQVHGAGPEGGAGATRGWVAGPALAVEDGAVVRVSRYTRMVDFDSRALARRFDVALFANDVAALGSAAAAAPAAPAAAQGVDGAAPSAVPEALAAMPGTAARGHGAPSARAGALPPGASTLPAGHPPIGAEGHGVGAQVDAKQPAGALPKLPERFAAIDVEPADATVAVVHHTRQERVGALLAVRGVVVRVVTGVLGKNWLRLADGTGEGDQAVLLVATTDEIATGAQVLVRGTLRLDHDVGQGLRYATLLEAESITVESQAPANRDGREGQPE